MHPRLVLHTRVVRGSGGGPDKTILNSPRFLEDAGYSMLCAFMRHPQDADFSRLEARARRWNASLLPVDDMGPLDHRLPGRFRKICTEHRPVIWHAHDYKSNLLGILAKRSHPMRLVTTVHGWGVKGSWRASLYYALDRLLLRYYDEVICVSPNLRASCLRLGVEEESCWLVPNAIDTDEYRRLEPSEAAKPRYGVSATRCVIGAVGRLSPEKGFDSLIRAVGRLAAQELDVELWIVGEGGERNNLEQLALDLGLGERVKLLGFHEDTLSVYQAMDVFALSSTREGFPNALLEAMALEIPVLATRVAGVPTLIRDRENGLLVEPGSVDALAQGLECLVRDGNLRQRLRHSGRRVIEASYSFRKRMTAIREIYDRTLANEER